MITEPTATPMQLLAMPGAPVIHQALCAAAKLGVADMLRGGPRSTAYLASQLDVDESALYRVLRALASHSVFEETTRRAFGNTELSHFLRSGVPGSVRALLIFEGTDFWFALFGQILYSIQTGRPAKTRMDEKDAFESLRRNPELARIFDDAMTNLSELNAPAIASVYDFGQWGSVTDVGGGNGILLAAILKRQPSLRGVLADQPHVLERARQWGFLGSELAARVGMQDCDFFREVPFGCRAYVLKNVLANWNDERAQAILLNCRRAVPPDGALIIVDFSIADVCRDSGERSSTLSC